MAEISVADLGMPQHNAEDSLDRVMTLRVLLNNPSLLEAACGVYHAVGYFDRDPLCALPWKVIKEYFEMYGAIPSVEFLVDDMRKLYQSWCSRYLTSPLDELTRLVRQAMTAPVRPADVAIIRDSLKSSIEGKAREVFEGADSVLDGIEKAKGLLQNDPFMKPRQVDISLNLDDHLDDMRKNPRSTMDVTFLDWMLRGGIRKGETLGMVIPSGVGKTTLAYQLAVEKALVGKHSLVLSFEQSYDDDINERLVCQFAGVTRDHLRAVLTGDAELTQEERQRWEANKALLKEHLHIVDMFASAEARPVSIGEIFSKGLEACVRMDGSLVPPEEIDTVIWDWWGAMMARVMLSRSMNRSLSESDKRDVLMISKVDLKTLTQRYSTRSVIFQQLAGKEAGKGHKASQSSHNAQGDTNFNNFWDYCMVASTLNHMDSTFTLKMDKGRGAAQTEMPMVMDGQNCKMRTNELAMSSSMDSIESIDVEADLSKFQ